MKSQFVDKFNHDNDAATYDAEVQDESHPIRAGYQELLNWVADKITPENNHHVLDLGVGTGNLALRLPKVDKLTCVDASDKMLDIAQYKLRHFESVKFLQADLLEFFDQNRQKFSAIISTYAIHHLTDSEKQILFEKIRQALDNQSIAVFGDLMFKNRTKKQQFIESCLTNKQKVLVQDIQDEFFWDIESTVVTLQQMGFQVQYQQFSALSWGIVAATE